MLTGRQRRIGRAAALAAVLTLALAACSGGTSGGTVSGDAAGGGADVTSRELALLQTAKVRSGTLEVGARRAVLSNESPSTFGSGRAAVRADTSYLYLDVVLQRVPGAPAAPVDPSAWAVRLPAGTEAPIVTGLDPGRFLSGPSEIGTETVVRVAVFELPEPATSVEGFALVVRQAGEPDAVLDLVPADGVAPPDTTGTTSTTAATGTSEPAPPTTSAVSSPPWAAPAEGTVVADDAVARSTFDGFWSGDWGDLVMRVGADGSVVAAYAYDQGVIVGAVSGGVMRGWWCEAPSRTGPRDAGPVEMRLVTIDGRTSIDGRWAYAESPDSFNENWDITAKSNDAAPADLVARLDEARSLCRPG